jgi:phosphatidylserine/phosphatidylglycerophosphate/cardiolipin synthase-like enzyme
MAVKLVKADPTVIAEFETAFSPEGFGNCALEDYEEVHVPSFHVSSAFICYASPDSTYAVTKRLIDQAEKSILIGLYDFTAGYMSELLKKAIQRGVEVSLMLDLDGRTGETPLFEDLIEHGCQGVPAPSCASTHAHYFGNCHEKVTVIDEIWTLVQSGNYSHNSIPQNEVDGGDRASFIPGNRDMGMAIRSKPLAAFFSKLLRSDMKLALDATGGEAAPGEDATREAVAVMEAAPSQPPAKLFKSKRVNPRAQ